MTIVPKLLQRAGLVLCLLCLALVSKASHIVGLDLYYTYISGETYQITLVAYGDCGPASASAFSTLPTSVPYICIYDGNTLVDHDSLIIQAPAAGVEITPVCPGTVTQCNSTSSTVPGIKKFIYTGTYTFPHQSANWRVLFNGNMGVSVAGRAAAITNIVSGTATQLEDTINNMGHHTSCPILTVVPTPFFCLDHSDSYNPGAVDTSGDSLSYNLVQGMGGTGSTSCTLGAPVSYSGTAWPGQPVGPETPLNVNAGSFNFNQNTGQISFTPNALQRSLVVYNVRCYHNGIFIGTCQREMTFLVLPCVVSPPVGYYSNATAGNIADSTDFGICSDGGAFTLHIDPTESDTTKAIKITASGLPAGMGYIVSNDSTNHPRCTISWTTAGLSPGTYVFFLTFTDNNCPLNGTQTCAYSIKIGSKFKGVATYTSCGANPDTLSAFRGSNWQWEPSTGLSCVNCQTPAANPPVSTTYHVTGLDPSGGCHDTLTVNLRIRPTPPPGVAPIFMCQFDSARPLSTVGSNLRWYTSLTDTGTTVPPVPSTATIGTMTWYVSQTLNGCIGPKVPIEVHVTKPTHLTNISPSQTIAFGSSAQLNADSAAIYMWLPADGTLNNPNINNPLASPKVTTTYKVLGYQWGGCLDSAYVTVVVTTDSVYIPDAFTPNGDGLNDYFHVVNLKFAKLVEMEIFNRYGNRIFETTDNSKGWDGTYKGVKQDMGIYYYHIIVARENGETTSYKGDVTLVR